MPGGLLSDRGVLRVAGDDARKFLQGLITNDIDKAQAGQRHPCRPAHAARQDSRSIFSCCRRRRLPARGGQGEAGRSHPAADVLQAPDPGRVRRGAVSRRGGGLGRRPRACRTAPSPYADPRLPELGLRILLPANADLADLGCALASEEEYHASRIALGVPEGGRDYSFGDAFPHEAMFDQLNGVDFKKGCFVGQEVVSRMEHRGTARKRIVAGRGRGAIAAVRHRDRGGQHADR